MAEMIERVYLDNLYEEAMEAFDRIHTLFNEMGLIEGSKHYEEGDDPPFVEMNNVVLAVLRDGRHQIKLRYDKATQPKPEV